MPHHARAFARHDPRQARGRLAAALAVALVTAAMIPGRYGGALRAVVAWDAGALVMIVLAWHLILRDGPDETRRRAATYDPGRHAVGGVVILSSAVSLLGTAIVLRQARAYSPEARDAFVAACALAVASAWMLTHTAYTLRYAHLYYRDDAEGEGGVTFPGQGHPAYIDFAYLAFTIGMCFQVSDANVASRQIRRSVLGQSLLSFLYNTVVLATAINLVVGILN
jgi:uncharacterized membrane protein